MSNLSLREIAQSQLDSTPVIDGQLIVCLDTGNAYRDTATAHVKIGSDLEVVSDLPLAPLAEKIYYLKPDKLYVFLGGNWTLLNDKTIDLDESIAKLPAGDSTSLNDDVEIITQDTDITQSHYYRRKLVVLWEYIKTKAQDFFAAKNHQHGKADITDFPTSMPASDVYPWAKAATKPSYTKAEVGLGKVDNTADADKTVKRATTAGTADSANSVAWGNVRDKPTTFPVEAHNHDDRYYTEAEMDGKLEKKSPTDHTHDLSELISGLSIGNSTTLNDSVQIITQDTNTANQKYYRRPLTVLWDYIKSKADSVYSAIGHNHKIQNLEEYTTRVYDATIVRQADTVLASPQDKDGIATFRKLDKNDVGLENVDNTADKNKNVASATKASGVVDYGNTANTIQIGYGGAGATTSNLTHIAGYLSGGKQIKDVSKDVLKSWLGSLPASGGTASAANSLNPTVTFTGGNGNTTGYRLIGQVTFGKWSNYRCVMIVKSRHQGAGIVSVCMGNNTSTISQANAYSEIKYWGPQNSGTVIYGDAYKVYISADGKTGYLFWQYSDYSNTEAYVISSDFTISNGTWMTSIGSGYGSLWSTTQVNVANRTTYVKDIGNSSDTTFAYSKAGMNYVDYTWLAGWNGYELRAVNKNQFAIAGHSHSFINSVGAKNAQTGRNQIYGNVYSYNSNASAHTGMPTTYTSTIGFGQGASGTVEICGEWAGGKGLWSRALRDCCDNWYDWQRIYTDNYHPNADYATKANSADNASTSNGVKDYNDGNRTIKIGYAGSGLTADNLTHIAGYTDNGTKLKNVNKDVLKSWIGKVASATSADNGVTASGKTGAGIYYVRFGNGTQMCWGFYKESDHSGSTSFPVAFNNSQYSISLTVTVSSNNAPYITGRSTTSFSYARHGASYNDVQWIAVGTWK